MTFLTMQPVKEAFFENGFGWLHGGEGALRGMGKNMGGFLSSLFWEFQEPKG
jgi:hypothetical protein